MRAPRRKRPQIRKIGVPEGVDLEEVAGRVMYTGSPEHKSTPSFAGHPRPRADASLCDPALADKQRQLTRCLRSAIKRGTVSELWQGDFPRNVWFRDGDTVFEGRLVNAEQGHYKGYPLERDEWPDGI